MVHGPSREPSTIALATVRGAYPATATSHFFAGRGEPTTLRIDRYDSWPASRARRDGEESVWYVEVNNDVGERIGPDRDFESLDAALEFGRESWGIQRTDWLPVGVVGQVLNGEHEGFFIEVRGRDGWLVIRWTDHVSYTNWFETEDEVVYDFGDGRWGQISWLSVKESDAVRARHGRGDANA